MLLDSKGVLVDLLFGLYNDILKQNAEPPESWKQAVIKVLHKSGDERLPKNYRPISIIPILYQSSS